MTIEPSEYRPKHVTSAPPHSQGPAQGEGQMALTRPPPLELADFQKILGISGLGAPELPQPGPYFFIKFYLLNPPPLYRKAADAPDKMAWKG